MSAKAIKLAARYGRKSDVVEIYQDILNEQYHVNAFNFPKYPIITKSDEVQVFNWGLIPFWTKDETNADEIRRMTLMPGQILSLKSPHSGADYEETLYSSINWLL